MLEMIKHEDKNNRLLYDIDTNDISFSRKYKLNLRLNLNKDEKMNLIQKHKIKIMRIIKNFESRNGSRKYPLTKTLDLSFQNTTQNCMVNIEEDMIKCGLINSTIKEECGYFEFAYYDNYGIYLSKKLYDKLEGISKRNLYKLLDEIKKKLVLKKEVVETIYFNSHSDCIQLKNINLNSIHSFKNLTFSFAGNGMYISFFLDDVENNLDHYAKFFDNLYPKSKEVKDK